MNEDTNGLKAPSLVFASDFETNETAVTLFFYAHSTPIELGVFRTDTLLLKDSNTLYKGEPYFKSETNSNLHQITLSTKRYDHFLKLFFRTDTAVYLSHPISVRQPSLNTALIAADDINVVEASDGYLDFQWPSVPASAVYFIQLFNDQGDAFMQLLVDRTQFSFYDLRRIVRNYTPELRDPELNSGDDYRFTVEAISAQGWHLASGSKVFTAP